MKYVGIQRVQKVYSKKKKQNLAKHSNKDEERVTNGMSSQKMK